MTAREVGSGKEAHLLCFLRQVLAITSSLPRHRTSPGARRLPFPRASLSERGQTRGKWRTPVGMSNCERQLQLTSNFPEHSPTGPNTSHRHLPSSCSSSCASPSRARGASAGAFVVGGRPESRGSSLHSEAVLRGTLSSPPGLCGRATASWLTSSDLWLDLLIKPRGSGGDAYFGNYFFCRPREAAGAHSTGRDKTVPTRAGCGLSDTQKPPDSVLDTCTS